MDNDEIERLKRRLYKKGEVFKEREFRSPLSPRSDQTKTYWEEPSEGEGRLVLPEKTSIFFSQKTCYCTFNCFVFGGPSGGDLCFTRRGKCSVFEKYRDRPRGTDEY